MGDDTRIYTHVSGKALKGMQQLFQNREIYISKEVSADGYTVLTAPRGKGVSRHTWRKGVKKVA